MLSSDMENIINDDTTTLEDLKAITEAMLDYCYDNDISIEDADL